GDDKRGRARGKDSRLGPNSFIGEINQNSNLSDSDKACLIASVDVIRGDAKGKIRTAAKGGIAGIRGADWRNKL
ncbi:hypothetical protein, partial [Lysinibacillus agricola]|uniref:hypothetical protein n=1 Tax=Lysinibacillus agricola TaxID=2590012 RepID=UPI003C1689B0